MTAPIRPGLTPLPQTPAVGKSPAALAAQRAFFHAALQQAGAPRATAPMNPPATSAPAPQAARVAAPVEPETAALPRLGLHLDIRV